MARMALKLLAAIVAIIVAIVVGLYYTQSVPDGMPPGEEHVLRTIGVVVEITKKAEGVTSVFGDEITKYFRNFVSWAMALLAYKTKPPDGMESTDTTVAGVPVRVYKPFKGAGNSSLPGLIYYHGGGWTFGTIDIMDELCYTLSRKANIIVVSVGNASKLVSFEEVGPLRELFTCLDTTARYNWYRLAPEYPFPAPFDDCFDVASALLISGETYGIDSRRVIIGGDSAGGNLAAAVTLRLKNSNPSPAGQLLIYPPLQFSSFTLPSMRDKGHLLLNAKLMAVYWSLYINGSEDLSDMFLAGSHVVHLKNTKYASYLGVDYNLGKNLESENNSPKPHCPEKVCSALTNPKAAPLMADDLSGVPVTLLITAQFDVLASEGFLYKKRLQDAGVKVTQKIFRSFHGFFWRPFLTDDASRATSAAVAFLKQFEKRQKS